MSQDSDRVMRPIVPRGVFGKIAIVAVILLFLIMSHEFFTHVDAGEIVVIQYPTGSLNVVTSPGYVGRWFGSVERFRRSSQIWFSIGSNQDESIKTRFNDGAHGYISGSMRFDMPENRNNMVDLYQTYRTHKAVEKELVAQCISRAVYMAGPLMSSKESYSDRRNELISDIEDQAINGVYRTIPKDVEVEDPITQTKKWVRAVDIQKDPKTGLPLRQEQSPIQRFGIKLYSLTINEIRYDDVVEKQIAAQQQAIMQVQTAIAQSKEAEQKALTVAKQGEAEATKAKWEQEVIKAKAVTQAEQEKAVYETNAQRDKKVAELAAERDKNVADLERQAAEFKKTEQIALGQGEAERKRLAMAANGALEQKLAAYVDSQKAWANAFANYRGNIVPSVMTAGSSNAPGQPNNGLGNFMELLNAKIAKDLAIDMGISNTQSQQAR
jgi:SPFH domain / Band 7 family